MELHKIYSTQDGAIVTRYHAARQSEVNVATANNRDLGSF